MSIVSLVLLCALLAVVMDRPDPAEEAARINDAKRTAFIDGAMFTDAAWAESIYSLSEEVRAYGDAPLADAFIDWADSAVWTREELDNIADQYLQQGGTQ